MPRSVSTGKVSMRFILDLVSRGGAATFFELTFIYRREKGLLVVSLNAGAEGRGVDVLFCGTMRDLRTDLADGYKQKSWLFTSESSDGVLRKELENNTPLINGLQSIRFWQWCCGELDGSYNVLYDCNEGALVD